MKKVSIEYAHIYTNQDYKLDCDIFKIEIDKVLSITKRGEVDLVVMVDDYSFPDATFNYDQFIKYLEENTNYKVDNMIKESQLINDCNIVLGKINNEKLKAEIISWIDNNKKYPCSLFIATWYLIRLGKIESELLTEHSRAEKLINILPRSFSKFEEKGLEIIENTEWNNETVNINNIYFDGRGI
jgi:hypothetical protein